LPLALTDFEVAITAVNGQPYQANNTDTLRALGQVRIQGEIQDRNGTYQPGFNGEVQLAVYDKPQIRRTYKANYLWSDQSVLLFNGRATVTAGRFDLTFVLPLDINYAPGNGRLTVYADLANQAALGCTDDFIICCTEPGVDPNASTPPMVELYLNDENWIDGGMTNQEPLLLANVRDDLGINTTGLGVGRDLTAVLNDNEAEPIVLNDFYEAKRDTANEGRIEYRLRDLEPGEHRVQVKVWDVTNKSATAETFFIVENDAELALDRVLNYPNPFTTRTNFFFEHNRVGEQLIAQIRIYTVSGRLVKYLESEFTATGTLANHIEWDGLDEYGDRIGRGVYVYEVTLRVPRTSETISEYQKLVLLR